MTGCSIPENRSMYDAILIGKDIDSLIAALALSCRGGRALLLADGDTPDGYAAAGCTFNIDPFPWTGLGNGESLLHRHMPPAVLQTMQPFLTPLNPALQIILPGHRLDIFSSPQRFLQELIREFPHKRSTLGAFLDAVSRADRSLKELLFAYPSLRPGTAKMYPRFLKMLALYRRDKSRGDRLLRVLNRDDDLRGVVGAELALLSHLFPADVKHSPLWPHVLSAPLQGVFYPLGGKQAVRTALEDLFARQGGVLLKGCTIERISRGSGFYQIEGRSGEEKLQCASANLVISTAWNNIDRLLQIDPRKARRLDGRLRRAEKKAHPFTLHMSIVDRGLPEKLCEYSALISDPRHPLQGLNFIFLELSRKGDEGRAPAGKRALSATVFLNESASGPSDGDLSDLAEKMLEQLDVFLPFLSENIDALDKSRCIDLFRQCGETASRRFRISRPSYLRLSTLPGITPFQNVYLTGKDLFANLGFQGDVLSGLNAATLSSGGTL